MLTAIFLVIVWIMILLTLVSIITFISWLISEKDIKKAKEVENNNNIK